MKITSTLTLCLILLGVFSASAAKPKIQLYNENAPQGGVFYYAVPAEPPSLNPLGYADLYATYVLGYIVPTLLQTNPETYELEPFFAEKYEVSKDGKVFTFVLREGLKWQDGQPLTSEDIKFSFEAIFNPAYLAAPKIPYFESFEKVEAVDARTVKFIAKKKYFKNLEVASSMFILPKHIYGDPNKGPKIVKDVIGAGPYMLEKNDIGQRITLKRNPLFFGYKDPAYKGQNNFDKIVFRWVKEDNIRIEMVKKGDVDFVGHYDVTPEDYMQKAVGPEWGSKVFKEKIETKMPKSYSFIGFNQLNPILADRDTRIALTYLCNRDLMIQKFRFNMSKPGTGPWHYKSDYASKNVKPIPYDPKKAAELLAKAGWTDADKNGVLEKTISGKKVEFKITLSYANKDSEKYWTLYKEDLAKAGVQLNLQLLEWNAFTKLLEEKKFDAIAMGWGGGSVDPDPKQIWHSESAKSGGSNFISYKNPEVDKLIDEAALELNKQKRIKMDQKVYELIAADAPYIFLFNNVYELYLHTARIGMVRTNNTYDIGVGGWWIKP